MEQYLSPHKDNVKQMEEYILEMKEELGLAENVMAQLSIKYPDNVEEPLLLQVLKSR